MRRPLLVLAWLVLLAPAAVWGDSNAKNKATCEKVSTTLSAPADAKAWSEPLKQCIECGIEYSLLPLRFKGKAAIDAAIAANDGNDLTPQQLDDKDPLGEGPVPEKWEDVSNPFACPNPLLDPSPYAEGSERASLRYCAAYVQAKMAACKKYQNTLDAAHAEAVGKVTQKWEELKGKFCKKLGLQAVKKGGGDSDPLRCGDAWDAFKNISATTADWEKVGVSPYCSLVADKTYEAAGNDLDATWCPKPFQHLFPMNDTFETFKKKVKTAVEEWAKDGQYPDLTFPHAIAAPRFTLGKFLKDNVEYQYPKYCTSSCPTRFGENASDAEDAKLAADEFKNVMLFLERRRAQISQARMYTISQVDDVADWLQMTDGTTEGDLKIIKSGKSDTHSNYNLLDKIIRLIAQVLGTFGIIMLLVGAIYMIVSQGDENQLQKGKQILIYTVLGLLLGFLSYTIVQLVLDFIIR